jgi:hypothetical protein
MSFPFSRILPKNIYPMSAQPDKYTPLQIFLPIFANWFSCVSVVLVNKYAMLDWKFGSTLTCFHFVVNFVYLLFALLVNLFQFKKLSIVRVLPLAVNFILSIVLNNLSIQHNTVCPCSSFLPYFLLAPDKIQSYLVFFSIRLAFIKP